MAEDKMIVNKATGKLYPMTEEIRGFIADNIKDLLDGHRPTGITLYKRPKRVGLDKDMTFELLPESAQECTDLGLATIPLADTETQYYVSDKLRQLIVERIEDLLDGKRIGPLLFEGVLELYLKLGPDMQFLLVK